MVYFGNQSLDYFQTLYAGIVYHVEQIEIGVFFKKLPGCCKMLQNNMICGKQYNLKTNALITSKLGTQYWIVKWRRFRQVFLQKLSGCCNIAQSYYLLQVTLFWQQVENFCERNLFESIQNAQQAMHTMFGSDYCNISEFIRFATKNTILQHFASNHHFLREKLF